MTLLKPVRVTFTGADPTCSVDALMSLLAEAPWVELAFLYSASQNGNGRYPPARWIRETVDTIEECIGRGRVALHLCGSARFLFLEGKEVDPELGGLDRFSRIQLNGKLTREYGNAMDTLLQDHPECRLIVQDVHAVDLLAALPPFGSPVQVLFDASGGRGILRASWPRPLVGHVCGYAGGLGPENIAREIRRIAAAAEGRPYWIDMEGKLRDEHDHFSVARAREVIAALMRTELEPPAVESRRAVGM